MSTPINVNIYIQITYIRISNVESACFIPSLVPTHLRHLIDDFVILGVLKLVCSTSDRYNFACV